MTHRPIEGQLSALAGPVDCPIASCLGQTQIAGIRRWDPARKDFERRIPASRWTWPRTLFGHKDIVPDDIVTRRRPDAQRIPVVLQLYAWRILWQIETKYYWPLFGIIIVSSFK